jgi:predicted RNase H-like HicB family nuclease
VELEDLNSIDGGSEEKEMKKFTLEYWKDDDWFVGRLVEIPGVFSQGETLDELKENIKDAYRMMVESEKLDFLPEETRRVQLELYS